MPESEVVTLMRSFKRDIARAGSAQQAEMARRWLAVERRLTGQIEALAMDMIARQASGLPVTANMLLNDVRYRELLIQLQEEQAKYTVYAERTITQGQEAMASAGVRQASQAIAAQVSTSFNRLPVAAVEHMVGLTGAGTPLNSILVQSWPLSAQGLTQALVDGVALGWGPRKTARMMAEGMTGSMDRMLTIARTEQLRVHREASVATYKHSGIVTGYRRLCAHDRRTCAACILDEGHVYDLDEEMPEHPNGRCSMIPVVAGAPPVEWLKGEDWLLTQDAAVQQDILGKGHYAGWKDGQFALQDLVKVTPNSTWGPSLGVTPLKELGGQGARVALPPVSLQVPARTYPSVSFAPAANKAEAKARLMAYTEAKPGGWAYPQKMDLDSLPLDAQNSILEALDNTLGARGIKVQNLAFNTQKSPAMGLAGFREEANTKAKTYSIRLQKTAARGAKKVQDETRASFEKMKARNIANYTAYVNDPKRSAIVEFNQKKLDNWLATERWATYQDADDPLMAIITHEAFHIIDYDGDYLSKKFVKLLSERGVTDTDWHRVSEYGASKDVELFAETGTAIVLGVPIPQAIREAFLEVLLP